MNTRPHENPCSHAHTQPDALALVALVSTFQRSQARQPSPQTLLLRHVPPLQMLPFPPPLRPCQPPCELPETEPKHKERLADQETRRTTYTQTHTLDTACAHHACT